MTFDSILDASAHILEELGYSALTTNGVAGVAGVGVGTLYEYFPNKETIVAELARRTLRQIVSDVEHAFDKAKGSSRGRHAAVETLVRACMQVLREYQALMKIFSQEVPFFWELEEIQAFPMELFQIAWRSRAMTTPHILDGNRKAMAYLYLLIPIGRWVPYAAIVDRPSWLSEKEAEEATIEIFKRLLT